MFYGGLIVAVPSLLMLHPVFSRSFVSQEYVRKLPPITKGAELIYPEQSRRLDEEGVVQTSFWIDSSGAASRCVVVSSSGFPGLDQASCEAISKMKFDLASTVEVGPFLVPIRWHLERPADQDASLVAVPNASRGVNLTNDGILPSGRRVNLALYLQVSSEGKVLDCKVRWGSGNSILDRKACDIASKWQYQVVNNSKSGWPRLKLETIYFADKLAKLPNR